MAYSSRYEYEVFLSFRGEDTRTSFTDFLYTSMIDAGIRVYKDDEELCKGENFGLELLRAINQSKISIPIFSKGYASSVWCLKELVQMVECQKTRGQKIMPIFYDVAPSEVRHQIGRYGEAFLTHENKKRYDEETMRKWKAALTTVGELDGWEKNANRKEGEMAKTITQKVFNELKKAYLVVSNHLVGVDHHVDKIMKEIGAHISETRIVGIHGMGGVGKTTIAKIIYNELSNKYDNCCFLSDIRETSKRKGIKYLQQQLICDILKMEWVKITNIDEGIKIIEKRLFDKKVLLLLDDVEEKDHMDALVGKRDWFGKGSKLIITTRRKDVIHVPEVDWTYEITCLGQDLSLQLFSKHAFRRDSPIDEYINQSKRAVQIAGGLPLALEVIGSLLSGKNKEMWDATLKKLKSVPDDKVQSKLKISYDALDDRQQQIFLDIACHFIGYDKDTTDYFWDASELFPKVALEVLLNMSLIKIGIDNKLWMHDQLRDMGREIVRQESKMKIEKQRCVWNPKDGLDLLKRHEEKKEVEALRLKFDDQHRFTYDNFKSLPYLMFLEVDDLKENFRGEKLLLWLKWLLYALPTNIFQRNSDLLPRLRWLSWHNIRPTFNIANFSVENLIILDLSWSEITHDWKGWSHMMVIKNLKVLNLAHCQCLKTTPNFSAHSNLEHLILSSCESLIEIDRSICQLKSLVFLDVSYCWNLQRLPETVGNLDSLSKLDISNTNIKEVPNSNGMLKNLEVMKMQNNIGERINNACLKSRKSIPTRMFYYMNYVKDFEAGDRTYGYEFLRKWGMGWPGLHALPRLPESLIELELEELRVDTFPDLSNLANLKVLHLGFGPHNCEGKSYGLLEEPIPRCIGNLSLLKSLQLRFLKETASSTDLSLPLHPRRLPRLPSNLSSLLLFGCHSLGSMDLSYLRKLSSLYISLCDSLCSMDLSNLRELSSLHIWHCHSLCSMDLSNLSKLSSLEIRYCNSLCSMDLLNLRKLSSLYIWDSAVAEIEGLSCLENLRDLNLRRTGQLAMLPDLSKLNKLRQITVWTCGNLVEIQGELPQSLEYLRIESCESLQKLPDLSSLKGLQKVIIRRCGKLAVEEISRLCSEKSIKFVGEDDEDWYLNWGKYQCFPFLAIKFFQRYEQRSFTCTF
ncbi:hypothetical protein ACJRO7_032283 [Eucalyptus globulus]|uniref:TIR domain-containing protein n=1 Tax=Eucalyptus globulus TaxID=34317 RepID=A0ABD3JNW6_EUCGL